MTRPDAIRRIRLILDAIVGRKLPDALAEHLAERIYVDVVAPACDDEREKWVGFSLAHINGNIVH